MTPVTVNTGVGLAGDRSGASSDGLEQSTIEACKGILDAIAADRLPLSNRVIWLSVIISGEGREPLEPSQFNWERRSPGRSPRLGFSRIWVRQSGHIAIEVLRQDWILIFYNWKYTRGRNGFDVSANTHPVMQAERESTLVNPGSPNVTANNIVPFARKAAVVAA